MLRGKGHEKTGQPCQDVLRWRLWRGQTLLVVVADGAGSARSAELGAETASQAALESLVQSLPDRPAELDPASIKMLLRNTLIASSKALVVEAGRRQIQLRDLATTLLVFAATPAWAAAGQVGDGATVLCDARGEYVTLTGPPAAEYLNETVFLTSDSALNHVRINFWSGSPQHAAVLSDGLQMLALKMPGAHPHAPFFEPLFKWLGRTTDPAAARAELEMFLRSPRVTDRSDDDLTLFLATRTGGPGSSAQPGETAPKPSTHSAPTRGDVDRQD